MTQIDNDAYLILVYKDFDTILVSDYKEKDKVDSSNIVEAAFKTSTSKANLWTKIKDPVTGASIRLLGAGLSSSVAQSMASKINLPNALKGRIQSSIYDIVKDGKISNAEVADDFIGSCVNELDSVAISLGFPTPDALYNAIKPTGTGVQNTFIDKFKVVAKQIEEDNNNKKNKVAQDLTVLKFKLVTDDNEAWASELPSRKVENGFDIIDAIENSNKTKDFTVTLVNNETKGVYIHDIKAQLEDIRDKKVPFDIYVNDPFQKKQLAWKYCFFTNLAWSVEGINTFNCTMGITQIPKYSVTTKQVSAIMGNGASNRGGSKAKSSKDKSNKTISKSKGTGKVKIGTNFVQDTVADIKSKIYAKNRNYVNQSTGKVNMSKVNSDLRAMGVTASATSLGIPSTAPSGAGGSW